MIMKETDAKTGARLRVVDTPEEFCYEADNIIVEVQAYIASARRSSNNVGRGFAPQASRVTMANHLREIMEHFKKPMAGYLTMYLDTYDASIIDLQTCTVEEYAKFTSSLLIDSVNPIPTFIEMSRAAWGDKVVFSVYTAAKIIDHVGVELKKAHARLFPQE